MNIEISRNKYVYAVVGAYVTGRVNAYEIYLDHGNQSEDENVVAFVQRMAEQDFDGGGDQLAFPEFSDGDVFGALDDLIDDIEKGRTEWATNGTLAYAQKVSKQGY